MTGSVSIVHHRLCTAAESAPLLKATAVALERCNNNDGVTTDTDNIAMALTGTQVGFPINKGRHSQREECQPRPRNPVS